MADLSRELRRTLEARMREARDAAEAGAADALRRLGVADAAPPGHLDERRRALRRRLRRHAQSLGDNYNRDDKTQAITHLTEAAGYIQWHRLLFARFLLERNLLRDADNDLVSLADCRDEAFRNGTGDEWSVAAAHTARMLPGVFPADDPAEVLTLSPEHGKALRDKLRELPASVFLADDSLGWTYQFWRSAEKKRVNDSQVKIGERELPAVTQLFTEPYMVRFLLHNTLGAWWAGKALAADPALARDATNEDSLRAACALPGYAWDYLRFVKDGETWRPAAGSFPGWPKRSAELTVLDPCCGSGHFLTEALISLAALRAREEGLSPANAVAAVLRDNLAGLEIDGRCVQIASFALALTAWRIGGSQSLPNPNVAWVGAPPPLPKEQFVALANGDAELRRGLAALHDLFAQAPLVGSLIEPVGGDLVDPVRVARIEDSIAGLVERMRDAEPERAEGAVAARGMADAAAILARSWVLQATNVPFLGRARQDAHLRLCLERRFGDAKADLAMAMVDRLRLLAVPAGTIAAVTPQNWLFLKTYKRFRELILKQTSIGIIAGLGPRAFEMIGGEVVNAALVIFSSSSPDKQFSLAALDANDAADAAAKARSCATEPVVVIPQLGQLATPDAVLSLAPPAHTKRLSDYADSWQGLVTGDTNRFLVKFWEAPSLGTTWAYIVTSPDRSEPFIGRDSLVRWEQAAGALHRNSSAHNFPPKNALGKDGILLSQISTIRVARYLGEIFNDLCVPIIPFDQDHLAAIAAFLEDPDLGQLVRAQTKSLQIRTGYFLKVPFDLAHWQQVAAEKYPKGLPEPYSYDPTQWLFHGHPRHAAHGTELHVALARLAGYRWPAENDAEMRLSPEARARIAEAGTLPPSDQDGLLSLPPVLGQRGLAERLRAFCIAAWGPDWQPGTEAALVAAACKRANDKPPRELTLDAWLRGPAARQHAKLFHDRPFLWWITDGQRDGFTAVAHYHRLTRDGLERLTYQVLGDWLDRQSDSRLQEAARVLQTKLEQIIAGETPFDIFVRWKPLARQPFGWDPDLDDGVRQNIRPFLQAGVLAYAPNILKAVDKGKDVSSAPWYHKFNGERRNDYHTTLDDKQAARAEAAPRRSGTTEGRPFSVPPLPDRESDPANDAALIRPLVRNLLLRGGDDSEAGSWLRQNESLVRDALDNSGGSRAPATLAANSFLQWLAPKIIPNAQLDFLKSLATINPLPLRQARPLYEAMKIAADISKTDPGSLVEGVNNRVQLLPPERRVSLGVTSRDGTAVPLLLFVVRTEMVDRILNSAPPDVEMRVVGQATALQLAAVHPPTIPGDEHRPGRSVAHHAGQAGSLGAYVCWTDGTTGRTVQGFLGASHVLARAGRANANDYIHSPGAPDADNNMIWRYGQLVNARVLVYAEDVTAPDAYVNDCDVAVAKLYKSCHARNQVPGIDPGAPLVFVKHALSEDELRNFSGDAFLIGRTTSHAKGRFLGSHIKQFALEMPDHREYIFGNVAAIESVDPSIPFSRGGDSGAIVYAFQGETCVALGFVIGAGGGYTYISPAVRCLTTMGVELLGG